MKKSTITIIIPAYKPDSKLILTIRKLIEAGFKDILVVNDGSGQDFNDIFKEVEEFSECTLLCHEFNRGKGAALKTAIAYIVKNRTDKSCVVTVDADGQHLVEDIQKVAFASINNEKVVLGVRNFSDANVPARSVIGNKMTSAVFYLFLGMKIKDTQTGLRAFPVKYLSELLDVEGERYEYETNVLFHIRKQSIPYEQVDITTVYIDENKSSHFRVVRDSVRIYGFIIKYLLSSTLAAVVDEMLFYIIKRFMVFNFFHIPLTFSAALVARVVSSLINFLINAKHVFKGKADTKALARYYILAIVQLTLSASLVYGVEHIFDIRTPIVSTIVKCIIDTILFFFSFRIQHSWVFKEKK